VEGGQESQSPKAPERYSDSYLAMEGAQKKGLPRPKARRRWGLWLASRLKELLLLLVILAVAGYIFRARLLPVLAGNSVTLPVAQFIEAKFPVQKANPIQGLSTTADVADSSQPLPTGGEVTFSSGQGFGTVTADDGSDSFRVVVPPEEQKPR